MIAFRSIFQELDPGELTELKVRIADWMTEASYANAASRTSDLGLYAMMEEFGALYREVQRVRRKKAA